MVVNLHKIKKDLEQPFLEKKESLGKEDNEWNIDNGNAERTNCSSDCPKGYFVSYVKGDTNVFFIGW